MGSKDCTWSVLARKQATLGDPKQLRSAGSLFLVLLHSLHLHHLLRQQLPLGGDVFLDFGLLLWSAGGC